MLEAHSPSPPWLMANLPPLESSVLYILRSYTEEPCLKLLQAMNKTGCQINSTESETDDHQSEILKSLSGDHNPLAVWRRRHFLNPPRPQFPHWNSLGSILLSITQTHTERFSFCAWNTPYRSESCQSPALSASFHQALECSANS